MKPDFLALADSIRSKLEKRFGKKGPHGDYFFKELDRLTNEWKLGKFTTDKSDIGIAGIKTFDSGSAEDEE
jgi:hypothetical protein